MKGNHQDTDDHEEKHLFEREPEFGESVSGHGSHDQTDSYGGNTEDEGIEEITTKLLPLKHLLVVIQMREAVGKDRRRDQPDLFRGFKAGGYRPEHGDEKHDDPDRKQENQNDFGDLKLHTVSPLRYAAV